MCPSVICVVNPVYTSALGVYMCSVRVHLLGIQSQPHERLDQGHGAAAASPLTGY